MPALTPVTIPVEPTEALALLLTQLPPVVVSVKGVVEPTQTFVVPVIAKGVAFTDAVAVTWQAEAV